MRLYKITNKIVRELYYLLVKPYPNKMNKYVNLQSRVDCAHTFSGSYFSMKRKRNVFHSDLGWYRSCGHDQPHILKQHPETPHY